MIIFFSGTGNSEYAAKKIGKEINDSVLDLFEKIRNSDHSAVASEKPWILVVPTYAWRIPHIVHDWLMKTELSGNRSIYFVMTCGGSIGNAGSYLKKLCRAKGLNYMGCAAITMPENYIALFTTPGKEEALKIIEQADNKISDVIRYINKNTSIPDAGITFKDKISSGPVNNIFYPLFVHSKKFYSTDACISCGKCERVCPLDNIRLQNGKSVWGKNCTHCMACISRCPKEAIEYGSHSKGMPRYTCSKVL